jgi:murein DD-endopeptidase MepM/ murein hydrolase activator NlpD
MREVQGAIIPWILLASCASAPVEPPLPSADANRPSPAMTRGATGELGGAVDARLARFRSQVGAWQQLPPRPDGPWPLPVLAGWRRLLDDLDPLWRQPGDDAVVRAYVGVEAELERTSRRFGPPPEFVATRVIAARERLARRRGWKVERRSPAPIVEWPVTPIIVTSGFGHRRDPVHGGVRFHAGLDLGGRRGDVITTAAPGRVIAAGWFRGYGRRVVVRHGPSVETWYAHLSRVLVREGDRLLAGDPIGLMGSSGRTTGPHLHFEVREQGEPVDPHAWLGRPLSELRARELARR